MLGAASGNPFLGAAIAAGLTLVHLALVRERTVEVALIAVAVIVGVAVEFVQLRADTYRYTSGLMIDGLAPVWLIMMWAQFATTFRHSLRSVMTHVWRATLFGAVGGPVAFLAGEGLGAVTFLPPISMGLLRLAIAWAIALAFLSVVTRRVTRGTGAYAE